MYLIFPESMVIPEVAERRDDDDFEDWLTAELIENDNQTHLNGIEASARGITDLWMLEIEERTGIVPKDSSNPKRERGSCAPGLAPATSC